MPDYISAAQAYGGQLKSVFHQSKLMDEFKNASPAVRGGVCNGLALHWILHRAKHASTSFWDWANTKDGIEKIAGLQGSSHGRSDASSVGFDAEEKSAFEEDLLRESGMSRVRTEEVSLDGGEYAAELAQALANRSGYVMMSLRPRDRDSKVGHALAAHAPPGGGVYFADANQGEAYFADDYLPAPDGPVEKWSLTKINEAFGIDRTGTSVSPSTAGLFNEAFGNRGAGGMFSPSTASASHALVTSDALMARLTTRTSSLSGWSATPTATLPNKPLVRAFAYAPGSDTDESENLGRFLKFYFERTGYKERYYSCRLTWYH